jgi:ribosomal protein S14
MSTCNHGNTAPDYVLKDLHDSQAGKQRHKCTECAYEQGYEAGRQHSLAPGGNSECEQTRLRAPSEMLETLPESQAGPGRHKCAICAYHAGFQRGRMVAQSAPNTSQ